MEHRIGKCASHEDRSALVKWRHPERTGIRQRSDQEASDAPHRRPGIESAAGATAGVCVQVRKVAGSTAPFLFAAAADAAASIPAARRSARPCKGFAIIPAPCLAEMDMPARRVPPSLAVDRTPSLVEEHRRPICQRVRGRDTTSAASTC
ncbi:MULTISPECIES: hypothetical protein [Burkholderia]|uniref:hypothetical protein n=1 Tax=Burkholderia TaxID=32008 RepID=UPI001582F5E5|nr:MULTISPECIES: hypothetical protein [Burkholderia]